MSTAVDTAFEELTSAATAEPKPLHLVCGHCWPVGSGGEATAVCGAKTTTDPLTALGEHKCARCVALEDVSPLPCGHP